MINTARTFICADDMEKVEIVNYYNDFCLPLVNRKYKLKYDDDWCAAFVSVVAHKVGLRDRFPFEVSTIEQVDLSKQAGLFFTDYRMAMENDLIFFDWSGNGVPQHVGFVVSVYGGFIETIEGNKEGTVGFRRFPVESGKVLGYARTPCVIDIGDVRTIEIMAGRVIQGKLGNGQERVKNLGMDYLPVQARVREIMAITHQK